jgi:hypothetical protein
MKLPNFDSRPDVHVLEAAEKLYEAAIFLRS